MKRKEIVLQVLFPLIGVLLLLDSRPSLAKPINSVLRPDEDSRPSISAFVANNSTANSAVATAVAVQNNYVFLAFGNELLILNVSNPSQPVRIASLPVAGTPNAIVIENTRLYISGPDMGVQIVDITSPASPQVIGSYNPAGSEANIDVDGLTLFVADQVNGLRIVDVTSASHPTLLSTTDYPWGGAYAVVVRGSWAYVAHWPVVDANDITDKSSPRPRGIMANCPPCSDIAIDGVMLTSIQNRYEGGLGGTGTLRISNISDPNGGTVLGSLSLDNSWFQDVETISNFAYIAALDKGLIVVNIGTPGNPQVAGQYNTLGTSRDVAISGMYAYLADEDAGLRILDVSNPGSISEVGHYHPAEDSSLGECTPNGFFRMRMVDNGLWAGQAFHCCACSVSA